MSDPVFLGVSLKMYLDHAATLSWVDKVVGIADSEPAVRDGRVQLAVLPTFVSIPGVAALTRGTPVMVGAQDVSWADAGAFTGEVSGRDLATLGCRYVEIGHAERRRLFAEDDAMIAGKFAAAGRNGLIPLLCVGEREHVDAAAAGDICVQQVQAALADVDEPMPEVIVAYEPVWAIGADRPAGADHVRAVCERVRSGLRAEQRIERARVIYGGSAGPGLLTELGTATDGLFLGRFAHDPEAVRMMVGEAARLGW